MKRLDFINGKIQVKGYGHYCEIVNELNNLGALWQSGTGAILMKISDHFKPGYIYVNKGVITWDGRYDTHFEECHRRFIRNPLPLLEKVPCPMNSNCS